LVIGSWLLDSFIQSGVAATALQSSQFRPKFLSQQIPLLVDFQAILQLP
jgi:hypothetical protein